MAWAAIVAMVGLSIFVVTRTIRSDAALTADDRRLNHGLTARNLDDALVFLPQLGPPALLVTFGTAMNTYGYTGRVVYALDEGAREDRAIAAEFPGRRAYLLVVSGTYRDQPLDRTLTSTLVPLALAGSTG